jgi:hypothetical protein
VLKYRSITTSGWWKYIQMKIVDRNRTVNCVITNLQFLLGSMHRFEHVKENWYMLFLKLSLYVKDF